jgi:hypothetical protein
MLKTMSSLEGKKLRKTASSRDILGKITRPAPRPPIEGAGEKEMDKERPLSSEVDAGVEAWRASVPKTVEVMDQVAEVEEKCRGFLHDFSWYGYLHVAMEIEQVDVSRDDMRISKGMLSSTTGIWPRLTIQYKWK